MKKTKPEDIVSVKRRTEHGEFELTGETRKVAIRAARQWGFIDCGGPIQTIEVNGTRYLFEMHQYCGPVAIKPNGDARKSQPMEFLEAASLWARQGQKVDKNGLCIWEWRPLT
jgi:hypothetical protein